MVTSVLSLPGLTPLQGNRFRQSNRLHVPLHDNCLLQSHMPKPHPQHPPLSAAGDRRRISAIVLRDSVSRVSPLYTCSEAGYYFLQRTCLVKDLASHKKLQGRGGGASLSAPDSPELGQCLRPGQGQPIPRRPSPGHPRAGSAPAPPRSPLPDHRPPSGGLGRTGTRLWEASRSQAWHTVYQAASSSDGGPAHAPGDLAAAPRALASGTRPLGRGLAQVPGSAGRPASFGESRQAEPGLQWPWRDTCHLRQRASRVPSMAGFSPEPWPGH